MKMKLLYVPTVMAVMAAVLNVGLTAARWTTTGPYGLNLNGKMFTLSFNGGGISFYPPYFFSASNSRPRTTPYPTPRYTTRPYYTTTTTRPYYTTTTRPYYTTTTRPYYTTTTRPYFTTTTRPYYTTTRPYTTYPPWTSAPPTRGVSVCLRFLTDYEQRQPIIFTLSPSSRAPLKLETSFGNEFRLSFDRYSYRNLNLQPNLRFWSSVGQDIWTRVCVTVDSVKKVAQVFSGPNMSIRKRLPVQYAWPGEPVIDFTGFDGQLTDVQVWDYPLSYKEIFNYMTSGVYALYRGSVLTWSSISYSPGGNALLEDTYKRQAQLPANRSGTGRRPERAKKTREFSIMVERKEGQRQQL
ncbi:uncharacterized protein LOC143328885 [Chaetodon auriga]|uniref:uncharacterized protein LOC143328885 n=1 Tax=Chaetodon auriga TaxID=39042 RepID=UPI004032F48A